MKSKGYKKFENRMNFFRIDVELVDVLFKNKESIKDSIHIFKNVDKENHPLLVARTSSTGSRRIVMSHLRKTIYVSFLKDLYEEVTEYIRYILYQASQQGVSADRIIGEHTFKMNANKILSLSTRGEIVKVIIDQVFQQLEAERSTIELFQKIKNKLGLDDINQSLIDQAVPYLTCRHIFVHTDGKPNDDFKTKYPDIPLDKKGRIFLDVDFLNKAYTSINTLLKEIDKSLITKKYIPNSELQP